MTGFSADGRRSFHQNALALRRSMIPVIVASLLLLTMAAVHSEALAAGGWSTDFAQPSRPGMDGQVLAAIWYHGAWILSGHFSLAGGVHAWVVRWDGTSFTPMDTGLQGSFCGFTARAFAVYNDSLIIGGCLTTGHYNPSFDIGKWNGSEWVPFGQWGITSDSGYVYCLQVYHGSLYVGGWFQQAGLGPGSVRTNGIVRWDGAWHDIGGVGASSEAVVEAMTVWNDHLIVGGWFGSVGSMPCSSVAQWDGTSWSSVGSGITGGYQEIESLAGWGPNLYAGGGFTSAGGTPAANIASWDGSTWSPLGAGVGDGVMALTPTENGLLAGGDFTTADGLPAGHVARWDGVHWSTLGEGVNGSVYVIGQATGPTIVGGAFTGAGERVAWRVAQWDGSTWLPLGSSSGDGLDYTVYSLAPTPASMLVGGGFHYGGPLLMSGFGVWNSPGWTRLGPGPGVSPVRAICVAPDHIYAAGTNIVAWSGTDWQTVAGGVDGQTDALIESQGNLVAGGAFTHAGGSDAAHVARWDGTSWSALGSGTDGETFALLPYQDGLVAGGDFTHAGGVAAAHVAVWDGSGWSELGGGTNGRVRALCLHDGDLIVAGDFTQVGSTPANRIARWDGTAWSPFGAGVDSSVWAVCDHNGDLYAGGDFGSSGRTALSHIARWTGNAWTDVAGGTSATVAALASAADGLYAGGFFGTAGGVGSTYIGRWVDNTASVLEESGPEPFFIGPNPTAGPVHVRYPAGVAGRVELTICDVLGRKVASISGLGGPGAAASTWSGLSASGRPVPTGVYWLRLSGKGFSHVGRVTVIR